MGMVKKMLPAAKKWQRKYSIVSITLIQLKNSFKCPPECAEQCEICEKLKNTLQMTENLN